MKKRKIINKGYTIEVVSWENDADNYATHSITVKTLEEAKKLYLICTELFPSGSNNETYIGNSMDDEYNDRIISFINKYPSLFSDLDLESINKNAEEEENYDIISDYFKNLAYSLMGSSEYYDYRVCESCNVFYSDKDIYLEEIKMT
jgi:hypothetical protein